MAQQKTVLDRVVGHWRVTMTTVAADGAATGGDDLRAEAVMIGEGRYVREELSGDFGGARHEKLALLGWNATRERFEYATADNHDGVILLYVTSPGAPGGEDGVALFADYAAPDESGAGAGARFVTIRTVFEFDGPDRRTLRNFYRPAGQAERPFLEYRYVRSE